MRLHELLLPLDAASDADLREEQERWRGGKKKTAIFRGCTM